jgi:hypothetical protein
MLSAAGYMVFRADSSSQGFSQIGVTAGLSYADTGLHAAAAYRYKVVPAGASPQPDSPASTVATLHKVPKCIDPGQCAVR